MATVARRRSSLKDIAIQNEIEGYDYAKEAKRLISVIQRLEQWFRGEKLFQAASITTEEELTFQWNSQSNHFEWNDCGKWRKVVNPKRPDIMVKFISICRELHHKARLAKSTMAEALYYAANSGEKYLTLLSKHPDLSGPL
tara:strand:- start:9781 stop:10203 length:423 start_codon:yes stop_codon:yes gene_type:complete